MDEGDEEYMHSEIDFHNKFFHYHGNTINSIIMTEKVKNVGWKKVENMVDIYLCYVHKLAICRNKMST